MTKNQIDYWRLQEDKRHNSTTEGETGRHNRETEAQGWADVKERGRHNLASEQISWFTANESQRHNKATEALTERDLSEKQRHNFATEQEDQRYHSGTLAINAFNARETARANRANESLKAEQNALGWSNLAETTRTHMENEAISRATQSATERYQTNTIINQRNQQRAQEDYWKGSLSNADVKNAQDYDLGLRKIAEDGRYHDMYRAVEDSKIDLGYRQDETERYKANMSSLKDLAVAGLNGMVNVVGSMGKMAATTAAPSNTTKFSDLIWRSIK